MDVAQALSEQDEQERKPEDSVPSTPMVEEPSKEEPEAIPRLDVKSIISNWGTNNATPSPVSPKRTSSYEKYSAFVMPPLLEEKTPVASPASTLSRYTVPPPILQELELSVSPVDPLEAPPPDTVPAQPSPTDKTEPTTTSEPAGRCLDTPATFSDASEPLATETLAPLAKNSVEDTPFVHFGNLPSFYVLKQICSSKSQNTTMNFCQLSTLLRC